MRMELSELQKRVEALEKLTNQLAQWVGFSIIGEEVSSGGNKQKDEVHMDKIKREDQDQQQLPCQVRRGVAKKSTSGLSKTKKISSTCHDDGRDPVDNESLSSDDEWPYDDDAVGDPDFDIDMPPSPSGTGIRIKEEKGSDLDLDAGEYDEVEGEEEAINIRRYSLHRKNLPNPFIKLETMSNSTLLEMGVINPESANKKKIKPRGPLGNWKCKRCSEVFATARKLEEHRKVHKGEPLPKKYQCIHCPEMFETRNQRIQHVRDIHRRRRRGPLGNWKCKTCAEVFATAKKLEEHRKVHGKDNGERPPQQSGYNCIRCPAMFESIKDRMQHFRDVHKWKRPFLCPHCPEEKRKTYRRRYELEEHIRGHTGERPYLCQICGKGFRANRFLLSHMDHLHPDKPREPFKCDICQKVFNSKHGLDQHKLKVHTDGGNPLAVQCDQCFRVYADKTKLRLHIRCIHENIRDYKCDLCGQLFKKPLHLKKHLERHNNPNRRKRGPQAPKPRASFGPVPASHLHPGNVNDQSVTEDISSMDNVNDVINNEAEAASVTEDFNVEGVPVSGS